MKKITYPILKELVRHRKLLDVSATLALLNERHRTSWAETDIGGALSEAGPAYAAEAKRWKQPNAIDVAASWILDTVSEEPRTMADLRRRTHSLQTTRFAMQRLVADGKVVVVNPGKKPLLYVGV